VQGVEEDGHLTGQVVDSIIGAGTIVSGAVVERSVLGRNVRVNSYGKIQESILMDGVRIGRHAVLRRAIVDKNVRIPAGMVVGCNLEADQELFRVTQSGVVVVPKEMPLQEDPKVSAGKGS
jgi:glucose-1-phosphate adenylyltransferase